MRETDVIVVGAGAAGLSLTYRLCTPPPGHPIPKVTLVDAPTGPLRPPERTWCFWESGPGDFDSALTASWESLRVRGRDGAASVGRPAPFRYKMLRSGSFETLLAGRLDGTGAPRRVVARIDQIKDLSAGGGTGAEVTGVAADGTALTLRGRWVFDSRPPRFSPQARTTLLQHFRGWFVRTGRPVFDRTTADLMDFRTPQPAHGLSFGYVLPTSAHEALVEYTEFTRAVLDDTGYERALSHYTEQVLGLGPFEVTASEQGVIPMTDGRFPRRVGPSVFRIGTAGGATRPSTGYTFAAVQRQTRAVAAAYHAGRMPEPPPAYPARARAMDAVLLRGLDSGRVDGAEFFEGLFRGVPMERLLRFLDGDTRPYEDFTIGLRTPVGPMLRTVVELPWLPWLPRRPAANRHVP